MAVGAAAVTPRAPPTVDAEGHEPALTAAALLEPAAGADVAALELDEAAEEDDVELEVPQAASAATAISPVRSDGRVIRWDMGMGNPLLEHPRRKSRTNVTLGYPISHDK